MELRVHRGSNVSALVDRGSLDLVTSRKGFQSLRYSEDRNPSRFGWLWSADSIFIQVSRHKDLYKFLEEIKGDSEDSGDLTAEQEIFDDEQSEVQSGVGGTQ